MINRLGLTEQTYGGGCLSLYRFRRDLRIGTNFTAKQIRFTRTETTDKQWFLLNPWQNEPKRHDPKNVANQIAFLYLAISRYKGRANQMKGGRQKMPARKADQCSLRRQISRTASAPFRILPFGVMIWISLAQASGLSCGYCESSSWFW